MMAVRPTGALSPVLVVVGAVIGVLVSAAQLRSLRDAHPAAIPGPRKVETA